MLLLDGDSFATEVFGKYTFCNALCFCWRL